jgi:hypothetical protein
MNKTEITNHIAEVLGDRKQAKAAIDSMLVCRSAPPFKRAKSSLPAGLAP